MGPVSHLFKPDGFCAGRRLSRPTPPGCGLCDNCRRGYLISCSEPSRASYGWQRNGGNAPYLLAEERTLVPLPDELSYVDGALIACGFGTAYEGLRRIQVNGEGELLVVGLGTVGLAAAMIGRGMGARRVVGVERSPERRDWAVQQGLVDDVVAADDITAKALGQLSDGRDLAFTIDASGWRWMAATARNGRWRYGCGPMANMWFHRRVLTEQTRLRTNSWSRSNRRRPRG